mmetsp:Transcript_56122/g.146341  ORF Transcript_56122/g.146341 Transcript_56122/m.146341 type:complete len:143 (-) Transcript_56122:125-553(-)
MHATDAGADTGTDTGADTGTDAGADTGVIIHDRRGRELRGFSGSLGCSGDLHAGGGGGGGGVEAMRRWAEASGVQLLQGVVLPAGGGRLAGDAHLFFALSGGRQTAAVEDAGLKASDPVMALLRLSATPRISEEDGVDFTGI